MNSTGVVNAVLLSHRQVAEMLGVCARTVRRAVARGHLPPPLKFGGAVRFHRDDVNRFLRKLHERGTVGIGQRLADLED